MTSSDRLTLIAVVGVAAMAGIAAWLLLAPLAGPGEPTAGVGFVASYGAAPSVAPPTELVVDVEGGVLTPGVHRLAGGSRVADAIAAAGGYSPTADLAAAAQGLNLAAVLVDGQQIYVPLVGDPTGTGGSGGGGTNGGLLNLNRATEAELDALPGIGPVTVGRIVAARQERPFVTLDELVERKVMTTSQLSKIRDLVTVP